MSLVAILTANTMLAENKLWIEQQTDGVMAVMMENDPTAAALQFEVVLPAEAAIEATEIEGSSQLIYRNPERLSKNQIFKCAKSGNFENAYMVMIVSMDKKPFIGITGPVAFFKVRSQVETPVEIKLENVVMSTGTGEVLNVKATNWTGTLSSVFVEFYGNTVAALPGQTIKLPINLRNSEGLAGFQFDIKLPAGFTMTDDFELTSRLSNSTTLTMTANEKENIYRIIAVDVLTNKAVREEGEGTIFYAPVTVPEKIADDATIVINDVYASTWGNASIKGVGCSISVVDGNIALATANASVKNLQDALTSALAQIAETCPLVKDNFKGEDIQASINALQKAIDDAFEAGTLTADYDKVMAPAAGIEAAIKDLLTDATAAQAIEAKRIEDNIAAYNADVAALDALQKNLDDAVIVIDSKYADYKDEIAINDVQKMITDARAAAEAAFKAVEKEGVYSYKLDQAGINTAIDNLLTAAEAAEAEAKATAEQLRKDENKAAYDAALATLNKLYASYRETVAKIQADYADYENVGAELAVRNTLDAEKDAIEEAYKAVEKEGKFDYTFDADAIQAAIDQLLEDAKARAEKAENERQAANQQAYDADCDKIMALKAELDAAKETIKAEYPDYPDFVDDVLNISEAINAAQAGADAAFAACQAEGNYTYDWDSKAISDMIDVMLSKASEFGVEAIIADVEAGNAIVFTLDGKQHTRPVVGTVNIVVRKNGEKSKIYVK